MDPTIALVTFVYLLHAVIGIAHAFLGGQAEGVRLQNPLAFFDTALEIFLFKENLGAN